MRSRMTLAAMLLGGCSGSTAMPRAALPPRIEIGVSPQTSATPHPAKPSHRAPCTSGDAPTCSSRCQAGNEQSCGLLAAMYANAEGVSRDVAKARRLATRACDAHDPRGCNVFAYLLERGLGGPEDPVRARKIYDAACGHGEARACLNLGRAYHYGISGAPTDDRRALGLFVTACRARLAAACTAAGSVASADPAAESRYFEMGCRGGDQAGCRGVVQSQARVAGVPAEPVELRARLRASCDAGSAHGCKGLGDLTGLGIGAEPDHAEAIARYKQACHLGNTDGCGRYGEALVSGAAAKRDRLRGMTLLHRGCDAGDLWSCMRLDEHEEDGP